MTPRSSLNAAADADLAVRPVRFSKSGLSRLTVSRRNRVQTVAAHLYRTHCMHDRVQYFSSYLCPDLHLSASYRGGQ